MMRGGASTRFCVQCSAALRDRSSDGLESSDRGYGTWASRAGQPAYSRGRDRRRSRACDRFVPKSCKKVPARRARCGS